MAKLIKGMYSDATEMDQPPGTYRYARNIIDANQLGTIENEPGFKELNTVAPYTIIGVIPAREEFVIFTTDNTNSEIGLVSRLNDVLTYTSIYSDPDLNFNTSAPIKGEFRKDIEGNRIIAWIDDINVPRILNIDQADLINSISQIEIFPSIGNPFLTTPVINDAGGGLPSGAIIPITKYENIDGSETNWFVHDFTFYINDESKAVAFNQMDGTPSGTTTQKSITFTLADVDTSFTKIVIGYIHLTGGVVTTFETARLATSPTLTVNITGLETLKEVVLDQIITPTAVYSNAKAITQLAGRLFLGNLTSPDEDQDLLNFQKIALDIEVSIGYELQAALTNNNGHKNVTPPTFMPGEVYALYISIELIQGGWRYYHIPGRAAIAGDKDNISVNGLTYKRFQVEDTGYWENSSELYPDHPNFVGGVVGDLRNQPVRHHKMPALKTLADTTWAADPSLGRTTLPRLSLTVQNVNIPPALQPKIRRWKIFFAKKELSNSIIQGGGLLHYGAKKTEVSDSVVHSSGGNWWLAGGLAGLELHNSTIRCHSHDMLLNKDKVNVTYMALQYGLKRTTDLNLRFASTNNTFRDQGCKVVLAEGGLDRSAGAVIDYTTPSNSARFTIADNVSRRRLDNFKYLNENSISGNFTTQGNEGAFISTINDPAPIDSILGPLNKELVMMFSTSLTGYLFRRISEGSFQHPSTFSTLEASTAYTLFCNLLSEVHNSFDTQELIPVFGSMTPDQSFSLFLYGGDTFISFLSHMTASWVGPDSSIQYRNSAGVRCWHGYIGYTKSNMNYRHEIDGDVNSFYYGKTDLRTLFSPTVLNKEQEAGENYTTLLNTAEGQNIIGYDVSYNQMNIFNIGAIYSPSLSTEGRFPNTIIFSPVQNEESLEFSWRTFFAGDRAVVGQDKGDIINLQGFRNRQLLINTEDSLFRTRSDIQFTADQENVFFKTAELFAVPPEEMTPSLTGYAGTQHKFGCILTKVGYFFPDDRRGKIFLYTGDSLEEVSSNGMRNFFRDFMSLGSSDNPFTQHGYSSVYDERYNRILLTKKKGAESWTISYNPVKKAWVSYHSYIPDYMFSTSDTSVYSLKDNKIYLNNPPNSIATERGVFYSPTPESSFVDIVFNDEPEAIKQFFSLEWLTESYSPSNVFQYENTLSHLSFFSRDHCTGRIPLVTIGSNDSLYDSNIRNVSRVWEFHDIRDIALQPGFVLGFYNNFSLDPSKLNTNMEWYDQRRFADKFLICRCEFDNLLNIQMLLLDTSIRYRYAR